MTEEARTKKIIALLDAVDELTAIYGKKGEGEQWLKTLERIGRIDKLAKKLRKSITEAESA